MTDGHDPTYGLGGAGGEGDQQYNYDYSAEVEAEYAYDPSKVPDYDPNQTYNYDYSAGGADGEYDYGEFDYDVSSDESALPDDFYGVARRRETEMTTMSEMTTDIPTEEGTEDDIPSSSKRSPSPRHTHLSPEKEVGIPAEDD